MTGTSATSTNTVTTRGTLTEPMLRSRKPMWPNR